MPTVYQIDDQNLLVGGARDVHEKGHLQVLTQPPSVSAGQVARWVTSLHPVVDTKTYGGVGTGSWEVIEDHRKDTLWLDHGKSYVIGSDHDGLSYDGLGVVPTWLYEKEPAAPSPTLDEARATQLTKINAAFEAAAQALTAGYPDAERLTWPAQQSEALAWGADNATPTPYLDGIAAARGIDAATMRQATLDQVNAFQAASQQLVGTRQKLRDQINAATTVEAVEAVTWAI